MFSKNATLPPSKSESEWWQYRNAKGHICIPSVTFLHSRTVVEPGNGKKYTQAIAANVSEMISQKCGGGRGDTLHTELGGRGVCMSGGVVAFFFFWDFDKPFSGGERHLRTEPWSPVPGGREQKRMFPHGSIRWPPWLLSPASQPASFPCSPVWHPDPQASRARPCWLSLGPFCISSLCLHLNGGSLIHKAGSVCSNHNPLHSQIGFVSAPFCVWNCWQLGMWWLRQVDFFLMKSRGFFRISRCFKAENTFQLACLWSND